MFNEIKSFDERKEELIKKGKQQGYITYEDLAASLKGLDIDADALDDLYNVFMENSIAVVSEEEADGSNEKILLDDNVITKDLNIRTSTHSHSLFLRTFTFIISSSHIIYFTILYFICQLNI